MQKSLTLEKNLVQPRSTKEWEGWLVPWEVSTFDEDFRRAESETGIFDLSMYACIGLVGDDARDYLQRMSTVNFKVWRADQVEPGAFLTGRGQAIVIGDFLEKEGRYLFVTTPGQREKALEHIEKFHFAEKFEVHDLSGEYAVFAVACHSRATVEECHNLGANTTRDIQLKGVNVTVWKDRRRDILWGLAKRTEAAKLFEAWKQDGQVLGYHLFEYYRIRAGLPSVGCELSDKEIILEASLDDHVARNKGCYPGQEVVERIYTYGQVNKKLLPVEITSTGPKIPAVPFAITSGEKPAGSVVALEQIPGDQKTLVGLAYVNKAHWADSAPFMSGNGVFVRIVQNAR